MIVDRQVQALKQEDMVLNYRHDDRVYGDDNACKLLHYKYVFKRVEL
jgi:hypothetical protein